MNKHSLSHLQSLLGENPTILKRFIGIFCEDALAFTMQIKDSIADENWPTCAAAAHNLQNLLKYFDMTKLNALANSIERAADTGLNRSITPDLALKLETGIAEAVSAVRKLELQS